MSNTTSLSTSPATWNLSAFADEAGPSVAEQVAGLQKAGIKFVDPRGIDGINISELPSDHAARARKEFDAGGIKVAMFGSPLGKIDISDDMELDLKKMRRLIELSPILGCKAVRIFSYYNKNKLPLAQWQNESLSRIGKLCDLAAKAGMTLYHENELHIFGEGLDNCLTIARTYRKPGSPLKVIFDFDNFNRCHADLWPVWVALRDQVDAFHLKDSDAAGQHTPIGQGKGKAREILTDALARKFAGPVTLEPHLKHSAAVLATNVSGKPNQKFSELSNAECFHIAATAATELLKAIKAPVA